MDEPFDPDKLFKSLKTVDEIVPYDECIVLGLWYRDKKLPYQFELDSWTKSEEYGIAEYQDSFQ